MTSAFIVVLLVIVGTLYGAFYAFGSSPLIIGTAVVVAYALVAVSYTWSDDRQGAK